MTVLTWQNDPIYFDTEPLPVNDWINANELIESNRKKEIFLDASTKILNLFPIMVRRADFVRENQSDRILARFPYVQLTQEEKDVITSQELLIAERLRNYFYKSDNRRILEWREVLRKDIERGFVPLPFLRCFPEEVQIDFRNHIFSSARGETFTIPQQLTEELAYLCGIVNGDGSLTKYILNIVDFSLEHIRLLKNQFEKLFYQIGRIQLQTENSPTLIITNLWVVRFFSFLTNQPIGGKKYKELREPLIFREQPFRSHYWSGVMDADGSYRNGNITFTSTNKKYSKAFISFLQAFNMCSKLNERKDGTFQVYIPRKYHEIYKKHLNCLHPEKRKEFMELKKGRDKKETKTKYFIGFNEDKIINGLFDFTLLKGVQITGLGYVLKKLRSNNTQYFLAKKLEISPQYLSQLESNKTAISIELLNKILSIKEKKILPFLLLYENKIKYRRMRSPPVKLNISSSTELNLYAKNMIFYPSFIRIYTNNKNLVNRIARNFDVEIKNNYITNGAIRYYFRIFGIFK